MGISLGIANFLDKKIVRVISGVEPVFFFLFFFFFK
jgi:hypothetical protein